LLLLVDLLHQKAQIVLHQKVGLVHHRRQHQAEVVVGSATVSGSCCYT
jgi:hypothetical protein